MLACASALGGLLFVALLILIGFCWYVYWTYESDT
jgi:hypothetical protein